MAARLGVAEDDLAELIGANPAPLRAWVTIDAGHADDTVLLDPFGRRALGVEHDDTVVLRAVPTPGIPGGLA